MTSLRPGRRSFENIVILTGAGISQESGLETFRGSDGTWANVRVEDVATPEAFARDPLLVHDFYNKRRRHLLSETVQPNEAHRALADLQRAWTGDVTIVTQNIDDLHERAGAEVLHMHGELLKARCSGCEDVASWHADLGPEDFCSRCGVPGRMRPHVVWFGEMPIGLDAAYEALQNADLFLSIGTSGNVYPAAGFVQIAKASGAHTVELNLEASLGASLFDEGIYGPATQVIRRYVTELLDNRTTG